ncbi:MAG: site-2 protease family protein [Leptolyngbya sp.]|nr:site-2 protease family protein [Leptolyngbya sp.]
MQSGWRVGSILGIPLFIDRSWFIIVVLITLANGINPDWQRQWGEWAWAMGLAMALLLFGSVLLHELGHSVAAKQQGIGVNSITLFLFGGIAAIDRESKTPWGALKVALAGPLVSFGLFLLLSGLVQGLSLPRPITLVLVNVAYINLVLTLFNLIPGLPLDGGQVLKAVVWKITQSRIQGIRWAARSGQILGWLAIALGLGRIVLNQDYSGLWIAAIGWFALRNAAAYQQVTSLQEALLALTAADAMGRDFRVVDAHTNLGDFAATYLMEDHHPLAYFAASEGRYRGLVSIEAIRSIERGQWNQRTLQDIAQPLLSIPSAREATPLTEVITTLEELTLPLLTVLTPADAVAGVLDRGDIVRTVAERLGLKVAPAMIQRIKEEGEYPPGLQLAAIARSVMDD